MKVKQTEKAPAKKQGPVGRNKVLPIVSVIPYKRLTEEGYLVNEADEYQAFLKVKTSDLNSMNLEERGRLTDALTTLCRAYMEDIKLIALTYPTETSEQQRFWKERIRKFQVTLADRPAPQEAARIRYQMKLAADNQRRQEWVERNLTELTFILVIFSKTPGEMENRLRDIIRLGGRELDLRHISDGAELEKLLARLNNMNTEQ